MPGSTVVRCIHALWFTLALVSCGGGGGGDATAPPPAPPPPASTGLIPAAPTPGAVLHADASAYRPLIEAGRWSYRGVQRIGANAPVVYENVVTHSAAPGTAMLESASNVGNAGSDQATLTVTANDVRSNSTLDIGNGQVENIVDVELRSPVRVGDQLVLLDKRYDGVIADLDGDGRGEALDVAIYRRVVGEEFVDLAHVPQARTVRVTTYILSRVRLSGTGEFSDTESAAADVWYLEGVGVVKRTTDLPGPIAGVRETTTETLVNWDGVTKGIGHMPERNLTTPAGVPLRRVTEAVSFGTHVLAMSWADASGPAGVVLTQIGADGAVHASHTYTGMNAARAALVKVGNEARVIAVTDTGVDMYFADATGAPTGTPPLRFRSAQTLTINSQRPTVASDGNSFWLSWFEVVTPLGNERTWLLQNFGADGQALAPAVTLGNLASTGEIGTVTAEGVPGRVVLSWEQFEGAGQWSKRYALIEAGAAAPAMHTLSPAGGPALSQIRLANTADDVAFLWLDQSGTGFTQLFGVSLDPATGVPARSNAQGIETEQLGLSWLRQVQNHLVSSGGPRLDTFQRDLAKLWPEDSLESAVHVVSELGPAGGPLATRQSRLLARGAYAYPEVMVSLDHEVLLFSGTPDGKAVATKVWRRP